MNKLTKIVAWHAEAKKLLADNFGKINSQFLDSTKKTVWLGLFLNHIKARGKEDGTIPHGQFGPWLERNVPEISRAAITTYMQLARDVCEKGKFQIANFKQFAHGGELPLEVLKLIEGKTQNQLCLEYKQMELGADGEFHVKRGRLKDTKGCTKLMRLNAKLKDEEDRLKTLALNAPMVSLWLKQNCTLAGFPDLIKMPGGKIALDQIREAVKDTHLFFESLKRGASRTGQEEQ